jgi:hypothetical protein
MSMNAIIQSWATERCIGIEVSTTEFKRLLAYYIELTGRFTKLIDRVGALEAYGLVVILLLELVDVFERFERAVNRADSAKRKT